MGIFRSYQAEVAHIAMDADGMIPAALTERIQSLRAAGKQLKVIARAAAIWRAMEPHRDDIAVKGLKNLNRFFGKQK